jgi:hypothetical protein
MGQKSRAKPVVCGCVCLICFACPPAWSLGCKNSSLSWLWPHAPEYRFSRAKSWSHALDSSHLHPPRRRVGREPPEQLAHADGGGGGARRRSIHLLTAGSPAHKSRTGRERGHGCRRRARGDNGRRRARARQGERGRLSAPAPVTVSSAGRELRQARPRAHLGDVA